MVILKGLKAATHYQIAVAAFTSKGPGPQSHLLYITTGISFFVIMLTNMYFVSFLLIIIA